MISGGDELSRTPAGQQQRLLPGQRDRPGITGISTSAAEAFLDFARASSSYRKQHPNFHRYAFYDNDPDATHPDKNIVWFRADGKRMARKDWENGGWMRTLGMFLNGTAPEIRDSAGQCAEDSDFLLLLNAHHEPVRVSHLLRAVSLRAGRSPSTRRVPSSPSEQELVKRNRLVDLAPRSFVVLCHER